MFQEDEKKTILYEGWYFLRNLSSLHVQKGCVKFCLESDKSPDQIPLPHSINWLTYLH